jgi:hypothetical protein
MVGDEDLVREALYELLSMLPYKHETPDTFPPLLSFERLMARLKSK